MMKKGLGLQDIMRFMLRRFEDDNF